MVCGRAGGPPCGYAIYKVRRETPAGHWTAVTSEVVAADPEAEAVLWRYLLDVDLTSSLEVGAVRGRRRRCDGGWSTTGPTGSPARATSCGCGCSIRSPRCGPGGYRAPGDLVIELRDAFRPATAGRYRISVGTDAGGQVAAAAVARTDEPADLAMDIADLGAIYLGGVRPSTLGAAGRIVESTTGALAVADRMFASERIPFCLTHF